MKKLIYLAACIVLTVISCAPLPPKPALTDTKMAAKIETVIDNVMMVCRTDSQLGGLYVRRGPGINYPVIDYLQNGDTVTILEEVGKWRKVEYVKDGETLTGYVYGLYLCEEK